MFKLRRDFGLPEDAPLELVQRYLGFIDDCQKAGIRPLCFACATQFFDYSQGMSDLPPDGPDDCTNCKALLMVC
jgi:hypothetical protein